MAAKTKAISYRWRAFHFCQWATAYGKRITIKACYQYMAENGMIRSPFRANNLRNDWLDYQAFLVEYEAGKKKLE